MVCNRGLTARNVADALRRLGADAEVLEGGMRGWLGALQARRIDLGLPGVVVAQVLPGDQLRTEVEVIQLRGRNCRLKGVAYVDGQVVAEAEMLARVVDR